MSVEGQQGDMRVAHSHSHALCHLPSTVLCWCWEQIDRMRLARAVSKIQPKLGIHTHPSNTNNLCEQECIHEQNRTE